MSKARSFLILRRKSIGLQPVDEGDPLVSMTADKFDLSYK
jgi:hypothetical protein